jgi:hypothetical protein
VKLVMTLRTRDEADIVDAQIAFHLNAGVDFVVAIDRSVDGTTDILESYARDGYLHLLHDPDEPMSEGEWVTRMARLAATDFAADWVINSDADEFFWPRGGSLKEVLSTVPPRFGCVRGMWRHFAPGVGNEPCFADRMTVRVCNPGVGSTNPYSPRFKSVHRGAADVTVLPGNHRVTGRHLVPLPGWYPIDVLHFPTRSLEQCESKYLRWWELFGRKQNSVWTAAYDAHREGQLEQFYESFVITDEALSIGLADGTLALDTRLRDALRSLRAGDDRRGPLREFELPPSATPLLFAGQTVDEAYLSEVATLEEATDQVAHAHRRAEALADRLIALEQSLPRRAWSFVRRASPNSG